jgi:hypothetical protein
MVMPLVVSCGPFATGLSQRQVRAWSAMPPKAEVHWGCGRDRLHADGAIGVSYRDATGTNTMTENVTNDRPSVTKPVSRPRSRKPATVSATALALHLDCNRTYIGKLEAEGVIQRQGDGFPARSEPRCLPAILAARAAAIATQ